MCVNTTSVAPNMYRKLSKNAAAMSPSVNKPRNIPDTDRPPVRHSRDAVPVSSGPAPQPSATEKPPANGADDENTPVRAMSSPVTATNPKGGKKMVGSSNIKSTVSAAGHTYDKGYDKWAKFDIDAALRSVDQEEAGTTDKVGFWSLTAIALL